MKRIVSTRYDGRRRALYARFCRRCGKEKYVPKHVIPTMRYCSSACRVKSSIRKVAFTCTQCGKSIWRAPGRAKSSRSGLQFCNRECKEKAQSFLSGVRAIQPSHYQDGRTSYRKRAFRWISNRCAICGYGSCLEMLDVHHKDGNRTNNRSVNLEMLCVWCHHIKTRGIDWVPWDGRHLK